MTQKIFDVENAEDMALLWSILPDDVCNIEKWRDNHLKGIDEGELFYCDVIKIDWHYQNRITRPVQEATEADVGKLCYFWNELEEYGCYGVLGYYKENMYILQKSSAIFDHCRRLTRKEIEELC